MQMILFLQPNQRVTCAEYLHYYQTFYLNLLRRYLEHKHGSTPKAVQEYNYVYKIIELYFEERVITDQLISQFDGTKMPQLFSEIYDMT